VQTPFGVAALGDVLEQHGHLIVVFRLDPQHIKFEQSPGGLQRPFEPQRLAGGEHLCQDRDPGIGLARKQHLADRASKHAHDAAARGQRRIFLNVAEIADRVVRRRDRLDDAEALIDAFEQRAIAHLAFACLLFDFLARGHVLHDAQHARAASVLECRAAFDRHPAHFAIVAAHDPVFGIVGCALCRIAGIHDRAHHAAAVIGVDARAEILQRRGLVVRDPEHHIHTRRPVEHTVHDIDVPEADVGMLGREPELLLARAQSRIGPHTIRGFDHDGHDAGGFAALIEDWRVIEVHPDLLGQAAAVKRQFLVAIGERAASEAHLHHMVVEIGYFGPAFAHFRAEQLRMTPAREHRIGVIVDHDAVVTPQHHNGYWRE